MRLRRPLVELSEQPFQTLAIRIFQDAYFSLHGVLRTTTIMPLEPKDQHHLVVAQGYCELEMCWQ